MLRSLNLFKALLISQLIMAFMFLDVSDTFSHMPHDVIELIEMSPDYDHDKTLFIMISNVLRKSTDGGLSWREVVKGLDYKCTLSSLAFSPSYHLDKTLFISSEGDGIYKSQDGGSSWFKANNGLGNLSIGLIAVSPGYRSDKILLAAGAEGGLYMSKNGGVGWYQVIHNGIKVTAVTFLSGSEKYHILVGDHNGVLHLSTDGGETWKKRIQIPNSGIITSIEVPPEFPSNNTVFVGTEKRGIIKVVDNGTSCLEINNGITDKHITSIALSPDYETDFTIIASTWHEAVFYSKDAGRTWDKYGTGITKTSQADDFKCPHFTDLRISKIFKKDRTIFLGGFDGLFKSTDGGKVWTQMETLSAKSVNDLALSPEYHNDSTLAISTYNGGIYITTDKGTSWEVINRGLNELHLWDIVFSPNFGSDNTVFTISNFGIYKSTNKGEEWEINRLGDHYYGIRSNIKRLYYKLYLKKMFGIPRALKPKIPFPTVIAISPDFASDGTMFLGTRYQGILKSTDGGKNWNNIWDLNWSRTRNRVVGWIASLVISPNFSFDRTLYAEVYGVGIYKTVDGGETWQSVNKGLSTFGVTAFPKGYRLDPYSMFLAISPNYGIDKTVFAGTPVGLFKTLDGGNKWQQLEGSAYDGDCYVSAIAISPNYQKDKTVIISCRGKGLFRTIDGGATFAEIGHDLLDNNYTAGKIRFSPAYHIDNTVYGAGEELFLSIDGGDSWKVIKRPIRYENKIDVINYQGEWKVLKGKNYSASSITQSDIIQSKAILPFVGAGISWIGTESKDQGIAKVYIDGDFKGYVDQFSETRNAMVISYSITGLEYGPHMIMIEVSDTKNPKSAGYRIGIDAFDIMP